MPRNGNTFALFCDSIHTFRAHRTFLILQSLFVDGKIGMTFPKNKSMAQKRKRK